MKTKKISAFIMVLMLTLGAAACGDSDSSSKADSKAKKESVSVSQAETEENTESKAGVDSGTTETWGVFSVFVPEGFTLKGGDVFDETDTRYFSVKKGDFYYFDFYTSETEDDVMSRYNYNKDTYTNEQKDVSGTYGGIDWTGFQYSDGFGGYGFEAYTSIDGQYIKVAGVGYEFESPEAEKVLGSLTVGEAPAEGGETAYSTTVEMMAAKVGLPEGYTTVKDAAPRQLVIDSDETGCRFSYISGNGDAEEELNQTKADKTLPNEDLDVNGTVWKTYSPYENCFYAAAASGDKYILVGTDYGTMEELQVLLQGIEII